ncbi:MAG: UvrD-helicase domain-containing protein, partial [Ginsengibacter sp.]
LDHCDECDKIEEESKKILKKCLNKIFCLAINEIGEGLNQRKLITGQLSYDDLIENLHRALTHNPNPSLVAALQRKYKAVFVDEFQDTDRFQYEIFHEAFGKPTKKGDQNPILFYIGDPKQSIYSFRKADIFTYFKAYSQVDNIYEMNINYRSSEQFIQAMNKFFLPEDGFDTFYFEDQEEGIKYLPVSSPPKNKVGRLVYDNTECIPISIDSNFSNKTNIENDVAKLVLTLFTDDKYAIIKDGISRRVQPSDIGILTRGKKEGYSLQNALAKYHIPSVTMSDAKVLSSNEARELYYLLEAFLENSRSNINRALLTSFTGYNASQIIRSDIEKNTLLFNIYKEMWEENGIYTAIKKFINDFGVQKHLLERNTENGERIITNLYQLTELLFRAQHAQNLGPAELIDWLKRAIEQEDAEGDELEQRIENDEEAVKIVTIHSSKGLQYNIVIAPSLDMSTVIYHDDASYRNEETSEYISGLKNQFTTEEMEIVKKQMEQENRRLLYVTLTRAVYKAFIYRNTNSKQKNTTLSFFTEALNYSEGNLIEKKIPVEIAAGVTYQFKSDEYKRKPLIVKDFLLEHSNWKSMSYTMLAAELENRSRPVTGILKNIYDRFIFSELAKGNITGNLLHFIFENINFSSDEKWGNVVERAIQRFAPARKEKYELNLLALIQNVLNAEIVTKDFKFNLSEINFDKRIHELEFDFPVNEFDPQLLSDLADEDVTVNVKKFSEMEGVMNGKIDMFFEYKGQYFVLDWKSTFLGDRLEDYNGEALSLGMNDHNYHLQYLIYSLAAKKYLESRLNSFDYQKDFGGVFYLFLRGMREGKTEGIFHTKPSLKAIEQMENLLNANVNLNV